MRKANQPQAILKADVACAVGALLGELPTFKSAEGYRRMVRHEDRITTNSMLSRRRSNNEIRRNVRNTN